tara:strand:+ start:81 stop:551 length:471 start_codon:yes stop_codon:yes gene_type:complete
MDNIIKKIIFKDEFSLVKFKSPYLYIKFKSDSPKREEFDKFMEIFKQFYDTVDPQTGKPVKFGTIWNMGPISILPYSWLSEFSKMMHSLESKTTVQLYGTTIIIQNNLIKNMINMFLKLYDNKKPVLIVPNKQEGQQFIRRCMEEELGPEYNNLQI